MENLLVDKKSDSFVQSGYDNWTKALEKGRGFERHEKADYHREAVLRYEIAPSSAIGDICAMTSTAYAAKRLENCKMLLKVLSNSPFLGLYTSIILKKAKVLLRFFKGNLREMHSFGLNKLKLCVCLRFPFKELR